MDTDYDISRLKWLYIKDFINLNTLENAIEAVVLHGASYDGVSWWRIAAEHDRPSTTVFA